MTAPSSLIAVAMLFATAYVIAWSIHRAKFRSIERDQTLTLCSWCPDKDARTEAAERRWGVRVSHGICAKCRKELK